MYKFQSFLRDEGQGCNLRAVNSKAKAFFSLLSFVFTSGPLGIRLSDLFDYSVSGCDVAVDVWGVVTVSVAVVVGCCC